MSILDNLKEKVTRHIEVYVKLFKINFIGRTANIMAYFLFLLIGLFIVFCMLLFVGFGLVEVFIIAGASKMAAFFITIGIYLLLLLFIIWLRRPITRFFASGMIQVLTEGDEEEKEKEERD